MKTVAVLAVFWLFAALPARAETPSEPTAGQQQRWEQLPEAEKQRLRDNYEHWHQLAPEQKKKLKTNYEAFRKLPEAERRLIVERFRRFRSLPAERQEKIRQRYAEFMALPPDVREQRLNRLRERRRQVIEDEGKREAPERRQRELRRNRR